MAVEQRRICDLCKSDKDVDTMTVVWQYSQGKPWEIDLCAQCYKSKMGDMVKLGRRAKINNVRPQYRVKKTEISRSNL